jgi:Polysaccharide deacetylase
MSEFRLDRTLTLDVVHPSRRIFGTAHCLRIPVLMYHGIDEIAGNAHPYFETKTSPVVFARQMQYLRDACYKPVDLDTAVSMLGSGKCPERTVVITFDDGFRDFYTHAMPILQQHGFPATMFVVSSFAGSGADCFGGRDLMSWSEIREVGALGVQIGSHTVSHPRLYSLSPSAITTELRESKQAIEQEIGKSIASLSYPYAFPEQDNGFKKWLRTCMAGAGYASGVTTVIGSAVPLSDHCLLPRIPVNEYDDESLFAAKLEGSYDWMHIPQLAYKLARGGRQSKRRRSAWLCENLNLGVDA